MIDASDSTRSGRLMAMVCAIMPPIETPTTCAWSTSRALSSPKASSAMSCSVYSPRLAMPMNVVTTSVGRIRRVGSTWVERPVSRLS